MDRFFKLKEHGTNVRTEIIAGITTFMTMAYILFVNTIFLGPGGAGIPVEGVFFATTIGAGLITILMGLFVNIPIALAPGMGLNAYFMTVVLSSGGAITWQAALGAVFISGIIFLILTVTKVRQLLLVAVPQSIKAAITVGISLFVASLGLKMSNLIGANLSGVTDTSATVPGSSINFTLGDFVHSPDVQLTLIGLILIAILMSLRVKGALLIGIIATTIIGIPMGVTNVSGLSGANWLPAFDNLAVGKLDLGAALHLGLFEIVFVFTFVELFDTFGTLVGTATRAGLMKNKEERREKNRQGDAGGCGWCQRGRISWHQHDHFLCREHRWCGRRRTHRAHFGNDGDLVPPGAVHRAAGWCCAERGNGSGADYRRRADDRPGQIDRMG
ncbi:hypothetical protein HMSSN036_38170 [Paenibacillus macerans]|nr:hypothetical protein HMSSN036_38170 [Paenibacillus macerans]